MERMRNQTHEGTVAWCALVAGVCAYEYFGEETLTHAWARGMEHPIMKFLQVGALGATALHLMGVLPRKVDPFYVSIERD